MIAKLALLALLGTASAMSPVFVSTDDLQQMLTLKSDPDLKIFDCTVSDTALVAFHESHIPTAGFIDLNYFRDTTSKYPFMLPGLKQFVDTMKLNGIKKTTRVVLYDTANTYYATRVYWMLRVYGHEMASVVDGGFHKWKAEGRPTETTLGFEGSGDSGFDYEFKPQLYRSFEQIVNLSAEIKAKNTTEQLSDARPKSTYDAGHIDQAMSMWWKELQAEDGTVKSKQECELILATHGFSLMYPQVTSCQTGVTASYLYAVFQHLGNVNTSLYDGSYGEWSDRIKNYTNIEMPEVPAEQGFLW
jgi:thiosulfate/3-mercaptopyruvate sulfurtransferase